MTPGVMRWVADMVASHRLANLSTLEVGALNVNGSVRPLFTGPYLGVDMREGPGVDKVANAHNLPFPNWTFDVVVSTEMLEHDETFWVSLAEMHRVLGRPGYLLLTTRGIGFPRHDHPSDYYRFTADALRVLLEREGLEVIEACEDEAEQGVYALARATK